MKKILIFNIKNNQKLRSLSIFFTLLPIIMITKTEGFKPFQRQNPLLSLNGKVLEKQKVHLQFYRGII